MPSSVVKHMYYSPDSKQLTVVFQSGAVYTYYDVPESVYAGFKTARSKGKYLNQYIVDTYAFERKDDE